MSKILTEADIAVYRLRTGTDGLGTDKVLAAYVTTEDKAPGYVLFKDHEHRTVMMVRDVVVFSIERVPGSPAGEVACQEILIHQPVHGRATAASAELWMSDGSIHHYAVSASVQRLDPPGTCLELGDRIIVPAPPPETSTPAAAADAR